MSDFLDLLSAILSGGAGNVQLAYDEISGFGISTVNTIDQGPETAIIDETNTRIVAHYASDDEALKGHADWIKRAGEGLTEVTDVGYGTSIPPTKYKVQPSPRFKGFPN